MVVKCLNICNLAEQRPMCNKHLINISYGCCYCCKVAQEVTGAQRTSESEREWVEREDTSEAAMLRLSLEGQGGLVAKDGSEGLQAEAAALMRHGGGHRTRFQ